MIILNKQNVLEENFKRRKEIMTMKVYRNHGKSAMFKPSQDLDQTLDLIKLNNGKYYKIRKSIKRSGIYWEPGIAAYDRLWDNAKIKMGKIKTHFGSVDKFKRNIERMPDGTEDFFDLMRIDITMRMLTQPDYVSIIANELTNQDFTDPITAQWLLDYIAYWEVFDGQGETVNQVFTQTGDKTAIYFELAGMGFQQDLYNMLFNRLFDMQKVNQAVAEGYVRRRNNKVFEPIINFSYPANKLVAANTTGTTLEDKIYRTMQTAIDYLGNLVSYQTKDYNDVTSGLLVLCHSTQTRWINRSINGRLTNGAVVGNYDPINEISRILPLNPKSVPYFKETKTYAGCPKDYFFLMIPREDNWFLIKRALTHKTGPGDAFALESDKDAWYCCDAVFNTYFLGGASGGNEGTPSDPTEDMGTLTVLDGKVVKVEFPSTT